MSGASLTCNGPWEIQSVGVGFSYFAPYTPWIFCGQSLQEVSLPALSRLALKMDISWLCRVPVLENFHVDFKTPSIIENYEEKSCKIAHPIKVFTKKKKMASTNQLQVLNSSMQSECIRQIRFAVSENKFKINLHWSPQQMDRKSGKKDIENIYEKKEISLILSARWKFF